MKRILSTKKLNIAQKELLLNSGLVLVEYDAISIELLEFEMPEYMENAIFTSQNAVRSFEVNKKIKTKIGRTFCVGDKTAELLLKNGQNVVKIEENASKLANFISKTYKNELFYFFAGSLRKEVILEIEKNSENRIFELKTYKTSLNPMKMHEIFDGILFFSPSGIESFTAVNTIGEAVAFCIGETTAAKAFEHTQQVVIANSTTVESVIAKAVKTLTQA